MKRAHVSLILVLGAVSASLSAVGFSRGQAAPTAVDESRICPCPHPVDGDPTSNQPSRSVAASVASGDTCPVETRWCADRKDVASSGFGDDATSQFAVTTVASWGLANWGLANWDATSCDAAAELLDADVAAATTAPNGDASWYETQAADCAVAPSCAELAAGESIDDDSIAIAKDANTESSIADADGVGPGEYDGERPDGWDCGGWVCRGRGCIARDRVTWADAPDTEPARSELVDSQLADSECVDVDIAFRADIVPTVQANQPPSTLPSCDYLGGCVDETVAGDEDRYGYLQPWCEDDDAVASQNDCYAGRCGGLPVEVPQVSVAPSQNVDSIRVTLNHVTDNWTAICGLITEPLPWMLPLSRLSDTVECSGVSRDDVIGIDDIAAAYDTKQEDAKSEAVVEIDTVVDHPIVQVGSDPVASVSETVVSDTPVAAPVGSLVDLCHDPRHSTGNDVVRWLNRLNDGLGDEVAHGDIRRVVARKAADEAIVAAQSSTSELAKEKIAAAGPSRDLPDPWWATLGVANGSDLVAAYRHDTHRVDTHSDGASDEINQGTTDGMAAAGSAVDDTGTDKSDEVVDGEDGDGDGEDVRVVAETRDWAPPAARWAASEWPGCDAYCDEAYDLSWPASPRHWSLACDAASNNNAAEVLPAADSAVAGDTALAEVATLAEEATLAAGTAADIAAGEVVAQVAVATSRAAAHAAARVLSVAVVIVRDWSVLLDGRAIRGATAPLVARRQTVSPRNDTAMSTRIDTAGSPGNTLTVPPGTDATVLPGTSSGQAESVDSALAPIDREQIWCDAARWPYEDL